MCFGIDSVYFEINGLLFGVWLVSFAQQKRKCTTPNYSPIELCSSLQLYRSFFFFLLCVQFSWTCVSAYFFFALLPIFFLWKLKISQLLLIADVTNGCSMCQNMRRETTIRKKENNKWTQQNYIIHLFVIFDMHKMQARHTLNL